MSTAAAQKPISASSMPMPLPSLLLVEDDRIMRMVLEEALQKHGYGISMAASGEEALEFLVKHSARIDAVILDREMPGIGGLEVVARMKADMHLQHIPVIMLTGSGEPEKIQEGIDAGVFYYLVKPVDDALFKSVIDSALRERRQKLTLISDLSQHGLALKAMRSCAIEVRTLAEAEDTASLLASCFPNPERVVAGLMELMVNAVEHGNLGIAYEEKQRLLSSNLWRQELDARALLPENSDKSVEVIYQLKDGNHLVQITDAGPGFDWRRYWHINPARATASHGRGIVRARLMAFDRMAYNESGNQVTVAVSSTPVSLRDYAW